MDGFLMGWAEWQLRVAGPGNAPRESPRCARNGTIPVEDLSARKLRDATYDDTSMHRYAWGI